MGARVYPPAPEVPITETIADTDPRTAVNTLPTPYYSISSDHGDPIEDEVLQDIAHTYQLADRLILSVVSEQDKVHNSNRQTIQRDPSITGTLTELYEQEKARRRNFELQFDKINKGYCTFGAQYLSGKKARSTLVLWTILGQAWNKETEDDEASKLKMWQFKHNLQTIIEPLPERISRAASEGLLSESQREILRQRWLHFDRLIDIVNIKINSNERVKTWAEVRQGMDEATAAYKLLKADKLPTESQPSLTLIYWATIFFTTILTLPTMSLAYRYSPHTRGTHHDPDFFLQLQSGGMQLLNCVVTGLAARPDQAGLSARTCIVLRMLLGVGAVSAVVGWGLYTTVPTEWSAMVGAVPGIVQAYVLVQVLFERKLKRD